MTKEEILRLMQNHILQLKALSDKGLIIRNELLQLNQEDAKWFEDNYFKWLKENGLVNPDAIK